MSLLLQEISVDFIRFFCTLKAKIVSSIHGLLSQVLVG